MAVKVAINGFGRIGRLVLRAIVESGRTDVEPVAINDLGSVEANAHLLRYDSVHGRFPAHVEVSGDSITICHGGRTWGPIRVSAERDPLRAPYQGVDVAMECTGLFTKKEQAAQLIAAGARKVLISAPAEGADATVVFGVNEAVLTREMTVVSNASCTTNCLAPMVKVLHDAFTVQRGYMVTCHSYTGDQRTVDTLHKDLHRARAAAVSMIPTTTGAARAVGLVLPELKGKLDGTAIRVPTPNVSMVSLDVMLEKQPSRDEINAAMKAARRGRDARHPGLQHRAAGQQRLQPCRRVVHLRRRADRGGRRQAVPGDGLVRPTNGAFPTAWPIPRRCSAACDVALRTLDHLEPRGKRVLLRADLNVPMRDGRITDATRIDRLAPTIRELADKGARVIVCSHFERPRGKPTPGMSLRPMAEALSAALGRPVAFAETCIGAPARAVVDSLRDGEVCLLENTRFHPGEEENESEFAAALALHADAFVNDAFSAAHRAHASTAGVARHLPAYAGRLMQAELEALALALTRPERPVCAVVGGSKVSTKIDLLSNLSSRVQVLVIGGAMANTFLAAQGMAVGRSLQEASLHDLARDILGAAQNAGCEVVLPSDAVTATEFRPNPPTRTVAIAEVPDDAMILDVGPQTVAALERRLPALRTLVWNGPLGAFETPPFDAATTRLARAVAAATRGGGLRSVAGGGDTVAALRLAGVEEQLSYVSAAGGAFLEWLEGKTLPGVAILES